MRLCDRVVLDRSKRAMRLLVPFGYRLELALTMGLPGTGVRGMA